MIRDITPEAKAKTKSSFYVLSITWFICFPLLLIHKLFSIVFWIDDRLVDMYNKIDEHTMKKHIEWLKKQ